MSARLRHAARGGEGARPALDQIGKVYRFEPDGPAASQSRQADEAIAGRGVQSQRDPTRRFPSTQSPLLRIEHRLKDFLGPIVIRDWQMALALENEEDSISFFVG
jgi:hypothetical protein